MLCPRCEKPTLEEKDRSGVTVDVCTQCRGVWLDRGELEKIVSRAQAEIEDLERTIRAPAAQPAAPQAPAQVQAPAPAQYAPQPVQGRAAQPPPPVDPRDTYREHDRHYQKDHGDYYYDKHGRRKKKGGFLDMLGDIFD